LTSSGVIGITIRNRRSTERSSGIRMVTTLLMILAAGSGPAGEGEEFETGGPLAGVRLPLWRTQHGEPPGYPGSLPLKMAAAGEVKDGQLVYRAWGPQAQAPELELYPGSVEHYRAYMFKYLPIRSFFDRQSQLKNFVAPRIPGAAPGDVEEYAEPVYWVPRHAPEVNTGKRRRAVSVIRCRREHPVFSLDLGDLEPGLYAIRIIGAVETGDLRPFRKSLVVRMKINDGLQGEDNIYRFRAGYCDEFYSVAEIYFHAPRRRGYRAEVTVDRLSEVDLLVHNISLDDALAGCLRRPIKTRSIHGPAAVDRKSRMSGKDRLARDERIWRSFPPINTQPSGAPYTRSGHHAHFPKEVTFGAGGMSPVEIESRFGPWQRGSGEVLLVNEKLNLKYTTGDLLAGRSLPDPYPFKDPGCGLVFPDPDDPGSGQAWFPIAQAADAAFRSLPGGGTGDPDAARDAAVALLRYAYQFPSIEYGNFLCSVIRQPGVYGRDLSCRRRGTAAMFLDHYANYGNLARRYDELFSHIQGNEDLARSIGRFVPWVKTSRDLVQLCDVYLLQTLAKRILRYHYHTDPLVIARCATILGDNSVTRDWMDFLFNRTFIYPLPPSGIQDAMITGCERDGCEYVGSTFYAQEEGASRVAGGLARYLKHGGDPGYDLSDPARYPKPGAHDLWHKKIVVAGCDFLRIGDVTGPDKRPGQFGRRGEQLRSRVLPCWAAILEGGHRSGDERYRHAAYLRMGFGFGHHHNDTMDLQVVAHGQPMTVDGGQRPGYSSPGDRSTVVHNLVQVDGQRNWGHSWVKALTDSGGAQYLQAEMAPPGGSRLYRRQIALIDRSGPGGEPSPNCYVLDVVRISGGREHVHCFHGLVNDEFRWNVSGEEPAPGDPFLQKFGRAPESKFSARAPEVYQATWRQIREKRGRGFGSEESWERAAGPRRFTRLHLLGAGGARAYRADAVCHKCGYQYTCSMVRKEGRNLESVFPSIVEPYLGEPFIIERTSLAIGDNERDALRAVAVEVKTGAGSTDICFADGRPEKIRRAGPLRIAAEFAFHSVDAGGLRQATLTGGTLLESPLVRIALRERERTGRVLRADHAGRKLWVDRAWPEGRGERIFEIGLPGRMTTYTASRVIPEGEGALIEVTQGSDYFRSPVLEVNPGDGTVRCALGIALGLQPGIDRDWVASDDGASRYWRADYLGGGMFRLKGAPVRMEDFGKARALRLWEYGPGDGVRQSTFASLRRLEKNVFELTADTGVTLALPGSGVEASTDRIGWRSLEARQERGKTVVTIPRPGEGKVYLRIRMNGYREKGEREMNRREFLETGPRAFAPAGFY